MTEFRSAAEEFVTEFLDYVQTHDILDHFNKRTQKMERSAGVDKLVKQAEAVFPPRVEDGQVANNQVSEEVKDSLIKTSSNVVDTREMFAKKVALSGGTRKMLRDLFEGASDARDRVAEFLAAEDGTKEFASKE